MEATYALHAGLHEKCRDAIERGLRASEKTGIHIWDPVFLGHAVAICFSSNDIAGADSYLQKMSLAIDQRRYTEVSRYHSLLAWQALARHQEQRASRHAETAVELMSKSGLPYFTACTNLDTGLIFYLCGRVDQADDYLTRARAIGAEIGNEMVEWMYLLFAAALRFSVGDDTALALLKSAMELGSRHGYMHFFFWPREVIALLCAKALEQGVEPEYVRRLILQHKLEPPRDARDSDAWPWPIKIYTLGRFSIVKGGQPLRFEVKAQQTPLRLLKVLIAFGGREVSEERLADALWPESEGDAASQALATTLFRLRKLIGADAVKRQEGCLTQNARQCWVDIWALERVLNDDSMAASVFLRRVTQLYHGAFLASEESAPWCLTLRERLHVKLARRLSECGKNLHQAGRDEEAIAVYQRALEIDDLVEEFYLGLIRAYAALGRTSEALSTYDRYEGVLSGRLHVKPCAEAERLHRVLLKGQS